MNPSPLRTLLIVGAETVVGRQCCHLLSRLGYQVIGTTPFPLADYSVPLMLMDVRDETSVQRTITYIVENYGPVSALINVAGMDSLIHADMTIPEVQDQLEQRFFATIRVCKAILPFMQRFGGGFVLQAGGLGRIPENGQLIDLYKAVQFSIAGITENLNADLQAYNIQLLDLAEKAFAEWETVREWKTAPSGEPIDFEESFSNRKRILNRAKEETDQASMVVRIIFEAFQQKVHEVFYPTVPFLNDRSEPKLGVILDTFQAAENQSAPYNSAFIQCLQN